MHNSTVRSSNCQFLIPLSALSGNMCKDCVMTSQFLLKKKEKSISNDKMPIKKKTPLITVSKKKLESAFKTACKNEIKLRKQLDDFKQRFEKESIELNDCLHHDLKTV